MYSGPIHPTIPHADFTVESETNESCFEPAKQVCQSLLPGWSALSSHQIRVTIISGGLTNKLFKLTPDDGNVEPVVVRIFMDRTNEYVDRLSETQALPHITSAGFGSRILGTFHNGRIETFLTGRTLDCLDIAEPSMAAKIARRMRKFHDLHVPQLKGEAPRIFGVLREYIKDVLARQLGSVLNGEQLEAYHRMHVESMHAEVDALEAIWRRRGWPLLYCHNDLLPFNIMFDAAKDEVQFIDFEYGGYNPRGYDLGYHFCEYCGMDNDFSRYPSKSEQVHFIRNYLAADGRHEVTAEEVESLYLESNLMALAAHLFVALWYLGQVDLASSGGDVDFFTMAVKRFSAYFVRRDLVYSLVQEHR